MSYYYVATLPLVELVKRARAVERPQAPTPSPTKNPYYVHTIAESQLQLMLAASSFHEILKICPSNKGRYCTADACFCPPNGTKIIGSGQTSCFVCEYNIIIVSCWLAPFFAPRARVIVVPLRGRGQGPKAAAAVQHAASKLIHADNETKSPHLSKTMPAFVLDLTHNSYFFKAS